MKADNTPSASSSYLVKNIEIERTTLICGHFSSVNTFVSSIIIGGARNIKYELRAWVTCAYASLCLKCFGRACWSDAPPALNKETETRQVGH